ncbi:MAG: helix-turn-helix domain-containing protein [Christensenellaceae bacterium]|jgi:tellurite methyltransferase|nr:helix-turn-helix domain-containing protein [Christensenellaceae bacterium]
MNETLKALRKARGLTQEQVAEALNLSPQAVGKWERGEALPDIQILPALAAYFCVSADRLLGIEKTGERSHYDSIYAGEGYYWGAQPSSMCLEVLKYLPPTRPLKLLDIGCGEGKDAVFFARCGYVVSAFDFSEEGLKKTRQLAEQARVSLRAFNANLQSYRLEEEYDILYSTGVLEYVKPELRGEIMGNYKGHVSEGGLVAFQTFVKKPFINPSRKGKQSDPWKSGELFGYFHDWYFEHCSEYVFDDCHLGRAPHKHASERLFARNIQAI